MQGYDRFCASDHGEFRRAIAETSDSFEEISSRCFIEQWPGRVDFFETALDLVFHVQPP
jgi:hypothetical protein